MARFFMGALALVACGKVSDAPLDAPPIDAALDAFTCAAPKTECAAACVDTTTDAKNCGGCGIACQPGVETCQAGACVDTAMTCADVAMDPNARDGAWTLLDGTVLNCDVSGGTCAQMLGSNASLANGTFTKADGTTIDCDMTDGGLQIIGVAWGEFDTVTPGYSLISLADFQNPVLQQYFIKYFNAQGGAALIAGFQAGDCCFRYDLVADSNTLAFGSAGGYVEPATPAGVGQCDVAAAALGPFEAFSFGGVNALPPLGSNFFSVNPPTINTTCGDPDVNPGFFWKVMQ